ncbi:unnamed protein product [Nezara viridula]|uniref:Globin domain-containing protein n=1 Tax=Nezara viridula TaxID=85310 RepID=A0A9P0EAU9_NEZVI|nr:unnamed protein product [Nezara viridula]
MSCAGTFSPATINLVQKSWSTVKEKAGDDGDRIVSMLVFKNFFDDYPSTIRYFKRFGNDPETIMKHETFIEHAKKNVFNSLDKTIGVLEEPEEIKEIEEWMGKIHRPKRIPREDFMNLGKCIVKSLKQALGDECTKEDEEAWKTVIDGLMSAFAEISSK